MTCTEPSRILRITRGEITRVIRIAQGLGPAGKNGENAIGGGSEIIISRTPPTNPSHGLGWLDKITKQLSIWDGNQQIWIATNPYSSYTLSTSDFPDGCFILENGAYLVSNDGTEYFQQPLLP